MMLLYGMILTTTAKVGTIQQNCDVTGEVNLRVKAKGFTHKVIKKIICQFLDDSTKKHHVKNSSVY